jgi:hypothetical protein
MVIRAAGYQVGEAYSCLQALSEIKRDSIDLILICHTVPVDEQQQLIAQAKSIRPDLPILCLASAIHSHAEDCTPACTTAPDLLENIRQALPHDPH